MCLWSRPQWRSAGLKIKIKSLRRFKVLQITQDNQTSSWNIFKDIGIPDSTTFSPFYHWQRFISKRVQFEFLFIVLKKKRFAVWKTCVNKFQSSVIACSGCWRVGMYSAHMVKCIFVCSSLSKAPLILFTWRGSWRGWRCRRRCRGYVPSWCSPSCPRSRPSCQGKKTKDDDRDGKKDTWELLSIARSQTTAHQFVTRQKASNQR